MSDEKKDEKIGQDVVLEITQHDYEEFKDSPIVSYTVSMTRTIVHEDGTKSSVIHGNASDLLNVLAGVATSIICDHVVPNARMHSAITFGRTVLQNVMKEMGVKSTDLGLPPLQKPSVAETETSKATKDELTDEQQKALELSMHWRGSKPAMEG